MEHTGFEDTEIYSVATVLHTIAQDNCTFSIKFSPFHFICIEPIHNTFILRHFTSKVILIKSYCTYIQTNPSVHYFNQFKSFFFQENQALFIKSLKCTIHSFHILSQSHFGSTFRLQLGHTKPVGSSQSSRANLMHVLGYIHNAVLCSIQFWLYPMIIIFLCVFSHNNYNATANRR